MSDQELYEIARQRIDRRNRRWTLWGIDLAILIAAVGLMIFLVDTPYQMISLAAMIAWAGVFTLHTIVAALAQSRSDDIEKEISKLREVMPEAYEKPKRLHLTDDGEITDADDWAYEEGERKLKL